MARYYNPSQRLSEWAAALLSPYIKLENDGGNDGDGRDNLSVGLWSGYVELKNVELRPEALEQFLNCDGANHGNAHLDDSGATIRWKLVRGSIDSVKIKIPWKSILVGSVYSSSKMASEGIKQSDDVAVSSKLGVAEDEPALASSSGCTTIHIQGVRLCLGYEVIHSNPLINTWQQRQKETRNLDKSDASEDDTVTHLEDQLRMKIRDEKNRILQIAERRLRAGVDPFPPSLMDRLNSLMSVRNKKSMPLQSEVTATTTTYLSRIEKYLSSTIKSLIWRLFSSLSVSVTQVHISGVGQSHYDKYSNLGETHPRGKRRRRSQHWEDRKKTGRSAGGIAMDCKNDVESPLRHHYHSNIQEGQVEVGVTLNRMDVRPDSLSNPGNSTQSEPVVKKLITLRGVGAFVRRIPYISGWDGAEQGFNTTDVLLRRDSVHEDDYILLPMDITASCKVLRDGIESSKDWLTPSNKEKIPSGTTGTSIGSDTSTSTRRRGKRDKAQKVTAISTSDIMSGPVPGQTTSQMSLKLDSISINTPHSKTIIAAGFTLPRLEMKFSVGHVRVCFSPRQIFSLHSLSTSMARTKNGRPATTIRAAKAYDRRLYARMAEEGECVMAWDDHIYRALPALQSCFSDRSMRPLPKVVSFWWKYAFINSLSEVCRRKQMLDKCHRGKDRKISCLPGGTLSDHSLSSANQSRIREEYVDLYLSARVPNAAPTETVLADVNSRLEKIEDQISVERILLLRHIAWAASIRCASAGTTHEQALGQSSPSKIFHFFSPYSRAHEVEDGSPSQRLRNSDGDFESLTSSLRPKNEFTESQASVSGGTERHFVDDCGSRNNLASALVSKERRVFLSFSAEVFVSGFSFAVCDFSSDTSSADTQTSSTEKIDQCISSDDISTLTGYSDDESKTPTLLSIGETTFDPFHRFWSTSRHGLHCDLIMLAHIVDIVFSLRSSEDDGMHLQHVKSEFSVGGITVLSGHESQHQNLICLGNSLSGELPTERKSARNQSIGVSGQSFNSSYSFNVCSAEMNVDWEWLGNMQRFACKIGDIVPVVSQARPAPGNQLGNTFRSLDIGEITLTAPLDSVSVPNNGDEKQFLVVGTKYVHVKNGGSHDGSPMKSGEITYPPKLVNGAESCCNPTSNDWTFAVEGFDVIIVTRKNDISANAIARKRLLHCPICIQVRHYGGPVSTSLVQSPSSFHVTVPSIYLLLSELRLRAISKAIDVVTHVFGNAVQSPDDHASLVISGNVLSEIIVCSQSIGMHLVTEDDEESPVDGSSFRDKLEYVVGSYITHLSCLDFEHPCQKAVTCMSRVLLENLGSLGIPAQNAKKCLESATANFMREASKKFYSATSCHRVRRTGRSNANVPLRMNPEILSDVLDEIVRTATFMTLAGIGDCNPIQSNFQLAIDAESFSICLCDHGKTLQVSVESLRVRSNRDSLLYVHRNGKNAETSRLQSAPDGNDVALRVILRDSSAGNNEISFEADCVQSTFDPDVYLELIKSCSLLMRAVSSTIEGSVWRSNRYRARSAKDSIVRGNVSSVALVLTNNLIPFVECQFHHVFIEKSTDRCRTTAPISFQARSVSLDCVCTSSYPTIISTYSLPDEEVSRESCALRVSFHRNLQSSSHDCTVVLDGVRITLLRQLLNDVAQYMSSPNHGVGLLISSLELDMDDHSDSCLAPSALNLIVVNSSIILPRDSSSIDMVGIEAEKISITYEQVAETWSIDDCSFLGDIANPLQRTQQNSNSLSSELFFDCINEDNVNDVSAFIPRYAVSVRNAHVFTALNKHHFSTENVHMPSFLACVRNTGRAEERKPPFLVCAKMSESMTKDLQSRSWEVVSKEPLNLRLKVDYVPALRVLIEDINHGNLQGISVGMRMSQLYLLMSVWYANNHELPVFFPYEVDDLEKQSSDHFLPTDWPEYGTSEFVERLKRGIAATVTYEMAICLTNLSWQCEYDHRDYFTKVPSSMSMMQPLTDYSEVVASHNFISVALDNAVFRITMDEDCLQRIAIGAKSMNVLDGRQSEVTYKKGIFTERRDCRSSIVDLNWGIDCGCHTLIHGLPLPFQTTVVFTPDVRCMVNLGVDMAEATLVDLSPIWILLDYFGLYFKQNEYGNPAFEAEPMLGKNMDKIAQTDYLDDIDISYRSIDFRLWLTNPNLIIPSSSEACIMLEAGGIFYRYISIGDNYSSQDINVNNIGVIVLSDYMAPSKSRGMRHISGSLSSCGVKTLLDEMSFSLRYDFNARTNYTRVSLRVPLTPKHFDPRSMDGIECLNAVVQPFSVPSPSVCKPFFVPTREMGLHEGYIFFSYEYMKLAFDLLIAFIGPFDQDESCTSCNASQISGKNGLESENQFSIAALVEGVKCVICDPVMGMHRPFISVSVPSLSLNTSQLKDVKQFSREERMDIQISIETTLFLDYFKLGLTRNWEPLVEPFKCLIMYERCGTRGKGITLNTDCPLHINITSAVIETIDDAMKTYERSRGSTSTMGKHSKRRSLDSKALNGVYSVDRVNHIYFHHEFAEQLHENERVAFSLKNSTGERVRVHTHSDLESDKSTTATISYLDHLNLMPLSFPATETVISNMRSLELPFKGDQNIATNRLRANTVIDLEIDLQVPGFRWLRKISFNKPGKHFVQLIPRSSIVQAKVDEDWRLRNALQILTEVSSVNGGRRLTIKSPFEIINKTNHPIFVASDPNPRHSPCFSGELKEEKCHENNSAIDKVYPDETHNISFLLLESALHLNGNHLGSIWIKPDQASGGDVKDAPLSPGAVGLDTLTIGFPSRPIQLAKILHESSRIFKDSDGDPLIANQVASGIEVSCPTFDDSKCRSNRPFCYVIEVKKSPFSKTTESLNKGIAADETTGRVGKGLKSAKNMFSRGNAADKIEIHAPIAYSLVIHPPLILENLLPERAIFELMHASTRNVVWWGCLEAGERISVYTVGLDAPILLLLNLGFCKTAVGEGALIHHGGEDGHFKAGWNTIQGAMKTSKDRVKKTLTTISESKDDRGAKRVAMIKAGRNAKQTDGSRKIGQLGSSSENDNFERTEGTLPRSGDVFGVEDIASEFCVYDSLGQRLTLHIENVLGSGGQRRVSVYSPFWIVNTTEHSLRYRQEKSVQFVAGTVLSPEKDGSKPVDGGHRSRVDEDNFLITESELGSLGTIFSGQPGALSLVKRNSDCHIVKPELIAALISNDLPLHALSSLAFMFNFHDVISLGGSPRLCIQLADTTDDRPRYTSDWSSGFGLESIGVTQIVGMHCKNGRGLEVSVSVGIAPGRLSNYTKIVRICPRYVIVNQLSRPIRLWQDDSLLHPNLPIEHSSGNVTESHKWAFADTQERSHDIINQYELLFGSPTWIRCEAEIGMDSNTTAHRDACYIATVRPSELVPFHLPDTRLERSLRVDFGSSWYLSPSFAADIPGEYLLTINPARDLRMLPPVSSRGAPIYSVSIPSAGQTDEWKGELGVWFETEPWGRERSVIVKGVKPGSYASTFTDIAVGDELIMIDATPIDSLTFVDAMKYMKNRLAAVNELIICTDQSPKPSQFQLMMTKKKKLSHKPQAEKTASTNNGVTLTFLTQEERLRRLRRAAVWKNDAKLLRESTNISKVLKSEMIPEIDHASTSTRGACSDEVLVEMKFLFQSVFVFVRAPDPMDPPHRIINRSLHWRIYYRQRSCDSHPWRCLAPGDSATYTWEEPMKAKKLSVRVGIDDWNEDEMNTQDGVAKDVIDEIDTKCTLRSAMPFLSYRFIKNEEAGYFGTTKIINLDEIGYMDKLPCPSFRKERSLMCQVDTEGATRVLIVSDDVIGVQATDETIVRRHLESVRKEISFHEYVRKEIRSLRETMVLLKTPYNEPSINFVRDSRIVRPTIVENVAEIHCSQVNSEAIEHELHELVDYDEGRFITKRNQVVVEVLEATGLRSSDLNGLSNPYVKVGLVYAMKKRRVGSFANQLTRTTYYIPKTLSPQWSDQSFVFDVPEGASDPGEIRRVSLLCVVKSAEIGKNKFLGQAHIHLHNVNDQKEHVGWYPLVGGIGQSGISKDPLEKVRGSIRLRVQWIYDSPGLVDYYLLCTERRLGVLRRRNDGLKRQLKSVQDAAQQVREQEESFAISGVPALALQHKKKRRIYADPASTGAREEISQQSSTGIRAVSAKKLKKTITAARFMGRIKRLSDIDNTNESTSSLHSGSKFADEVDKASIGDVNDSLVSQELVVDSARNTSLIESYLSNPGEGSCITSITASKCLPLRHVSDITENDPTKQTPNTQLSNVRWYSWQHRTNNGVEFPPFSSRKNSRRVVNDSVNSPTALAQEQGHHDEIDELLMLPPATPPLIMRREKNDMCELLRSRNLFSKAARRSLGSIFNPGGVLSIRPITALNLPDHFTSMFLKLRNGNIVKSTVSVDSKVAPVWSDDDEHLYFSHLQMKRLKRKLVTKQNSSSDGVINDSNDIAEMINPTRASGSRGNDLKIQVEPFETSKSLRLTVIGESPLQVNVEIGVLEIPLGAALECCAQSLEDFEEDRKKPRPKGLLPAYIRWYPLMSPSDCVPIEGDMGKHIRPLETEKLHDNMFEEYFSPCIKLAMVFQPNAMEAESDYATSQLSTNTNRPSTCQYLYLRLDRISAALIDSSRIMELVSFTAREADVRFSVTSAKTRLAVAIGDVQIDQQNYGMNTKVPVILSPTPVKCPQPTVQFLAWKDNIRSTCDVDSYEYVALQVQEMDLKMEESLLFDLWEFYLNIMKLREAKAILWQQDERAIFSTATFQVDQSSDAVEKASAFLKVRNKSKKKKIYVRELILGFFKINVSYFKSPPRGSCVDSDISNDSLLDIDHLSLFLSPSVLSTIPLGGQAAVDDAFIRWSENTTSLTRSVDEMSQYASINIIAAVFPSISKAPIRFQERVIYHVFESEGDILRSLKSFYSAESLRQIYKIVGSLDFVGNPTAVITSFRSGLRDFFLQPSRELKHITRNPSRFGVGVLKGTLSLVSNSASGIFGFASNVAATVGNTATLLTLDEQYQRLHSEQKVAQQRHYDRWKKKGFGHVTLMVSRPVHDIVLGVVSASTGLLTEPYRGAKKDGIPGVIKGTAIGVIGVVVKPIVGLSDAFAHVLESIDDIAKSMNLLELKFKPVERYRTPYVFGFKRMLLPFNEIDSRSAQLLLAYPLEKKAKISEETIVAAEALYMGNGTERYVVASTMRVALFRLRVVDGQGFVTTSLEWQIRFGKDSRLNCRVGNKGHNECFLCISRYSSQSEVSEELPEMKYELDEHQSDISSAEEESKQFPLPDTPKSFQPFKLSNLWPIAANEGYLVTRYVVEGEFKHRQQLCRIHNAICCILGDFDSIINERNRIGGTEGTTSFGPLNFERISTIPSQTLSIDNDLLYASLESTMWKCDEQPC